MVYLEHNAPHGDVPDTRHPVAELPDGIPLVHVTHFNRLMWDNGRAPTTVIEHGVVDPGARYTGELDRAATAINEPVRRGRAVGTDLLPLFLQHAPVDVFGMGVAGLADTLGATADRLGEYDDLPQEAMQLGMPVACLAATEAPRAVPPEAGLVSADPDELAAFVSRMLADPDEARRAGQAAREHALQVHGLKRFLADWDTVLADAA
jgi:glycosyltransferase involved in cell wall biosynthesis